MVTAGRTGHVAGVTSGVRVIAVSDGETHG